MSTSKDYPLPDRSIKTFLVRTNDGMVELNMSFIGGMDLYHVWGKMAAVNFTAAFDKASDAFDEYNRRFVDAKAEAAMLLIKATGAHA